MDDPAPQPYADAYLEGVHLFNAGRYYAAHEALEEVWRTCPKDSRERLFYQALIQIAAACLHRERGRWRPALLQYGRAVEKLDRVAASELLGMDLVTLRSEIDATFAPLTADPRPPLAAPAPWHVALPPEGGG